MTYVTKLDESEFNHVRQSAGVAVVDFYADWCGPCKALAPILERVAERHPEVSIKKINVDEDESAAGRYGVKGIPTLVFLRDGLEVGRIIGLASEKAIEDAFERVNE